MHSNAVIFDLLQLNPEVAEFERVWRMFILYLKRTFFSHQINMSK